MFSISLLLEAFASSEDEIINFLISKKANLDHTDKEHSNALHYALVHRNYSAAINLIHGGINIHQEDIYGNQPLWTAVMNARGRFDIVELLLEQGVDKNHKNKAGRSPLDMAIIFDNEELLGIFH